MTTADRVFHDGMIDAAGRFVENKAHQWEALRSFCESPIEEMLLAALLSNADTPPFFAVEFLGRAATIADPDIDHVIFVYQQAKVGPYRVDFLIKDASRPSEFYPIQNIVIECDGHDFHERTKEQTQRDRRRDRYMQNLGIKVLRFTGSEIYGDPFACADEIYDSMGGTVDLYFDLQSGSEPK